MSNIRLRPLRDIHVWYLAALIFALNMTITLLFLIFFDKSEFFAGLWGTILLTASAFGLSLAVAVFAASARRFGGGNGASEDGK